MHVAVVHSAFVLYWVARIRALAAVLGQRGDKVSAIETLADVPGYEFASGTAGAWTGVSRYRCRRDDPCSPSAARTARHLWALLEELQPDAVLAAPVAFPEGAVPIRWCKAHGKVVVVMDDVRSQDVVRSWFVEMVKRSVYQNVDAMLVPAPSHAESFLRWGVPRERIFFGLDVVDNDWFAEQVAELRSKADELRLRYRLPRRFFLGIGRQVAVKHWHSLIAAYGQYRREASGRAWDLVLVGDGLERQRLETQVAEGDIQGVLFAPFCSQEDLCVYYALAEALVLPSSNETWGLVVNEAMASGLPVLVSNRCGCAATLVREGKNGWTFSPDDTTQMADTLTRMACLDGGSRRAMGERSRAIISEWPLRRFAERAIAAIDFCKNPEHGDRRSRIGQWVLRMWNGRYGR